MLDETNGINFRPHPHWPRREKKKRSKLGCGNPVVATVLYTLHAKQQAMQHHSHKWHLAPFIGVPSRVASNVDGASLLSQATEIVYLHEIKGSRLDLGGDVGLRRETEGRGDVLGDEEVQQFLRGGEVAVAVEELVDESVRDREAETRTGTRSVVRSVEFLESDVKELEKEFSMPETCVLRKQEFRTEAALFVAYGKQMRISLYSNVPTEKTIA